MPAAAVYVVAVVGTVAAGFAFKHFVYDPHIAPKVDQWKHEFVALRDARRRRRAGPLPVPVAVQLNRNRPDDKRSDDSETDDDNDHQTTIELETMVKKESEVLDWRNEVERVGTLRQRKPRGPDSVTSTSASSTSFAMPPPPPPVNSLPTDEPHILFDSSSESSPMTSAAPTRETTPSPISPQVSSLTSFPSRSTLRSPALSYGQLIDIEPPTPVSTIFNANSNSVTIAPAPASTSSFSSPRHVPSLSLLHPVDLDHEHDVELLSAPSSRPDSPFSALSQPSSTGGFSLTAGSEENQRNQPLPQGPPQPGISQLLIPSPPMSHSEMLSASFYETPNASPIPSRTSSELDFMDAESLTFSTSASEFEDGGVRGRTESEFGGSEVDFGSESSWASVNDGSPFGSENGNRRR